MLDQIHSPLRAALISSSLQPRPSRTRAAGSSVFSRGHRGQRREKVGKSLWTAGKSGENVGKPKDFLVVRNRMFPLQTTFHKLSVVGHHYPMRDWRIGETTAPSTPEKVNVQDREKSVRWKVYYDWLVVWTPLKNISQLGWLFPIYGKIKMATKPPTRWVCRSLNQVCRKRLTNPVAWPWLDMCDTKKSYVNWFECRMPISIHLNHFLRVWIQPWGCHDPAMWQRALGQTEEDLRFIIFVHLPAPAARHGQEANRQKCKSEWVDKSW